MDIQKPNPECWRRIAGYLVVAVLFLSIGFSSGVVIGHGVLAAQDPANSVVSGSTDSFNLVNQARNLIQKNYVEQSGLKPNQLTYGAINGMVDSLGDTGHSRFLDPAMMKAEQNFTQGTFEGIGAEVQMKDGNVVIVSPIDGSPAQAAGVKPGDIIVAINGKDITGQSLREVVSQVLGPAGTKVQLSLKDPSSGQVRKVTITRAHIQIHNVTWHMLPGTTIAHLRIAAFSNGVTNELKKTIQEIKQAGATGLVLDLRNNPGGLFDEAVGVTSQFLKDGNVMEIKNAAGEIKPIPVRPEGLATDIPMVVLINHGTGSSAEIVSGALQDASRAKLVGETTFGTGTVLSQFDLQDGSALLLATEEWLTPKGRVIWHQGISPDVTMALLANASPLFPEQEQTLTADQLKASGDTQLLRALELLQSGMQQTN
jgi:carboxyl-terminal processing protease